MDDFKKCLIDYNNFKVFAVYENGKIEEHISECLDKILSIIKVQSKNLNLSREEKNTILNNIKNETIHQNTELSTPYLSLQSQQTTSLQT